MKNKKIKFGALACVATLAMCALAVLLTSCGKTTADYVLGNMSEWTKVYYYGEGEGIYASISSGTREETYLLNGKSEDSVDFALVSVNFDSAPSGSLIKATITVDGSSSEVELEIGGTNSSFMVDLERALSGDEEIYLEYNGQTITFENLSKDFAISDEQAIEIGAAQLESEILELKSGVILNSECYLRVLDKKANNFDNVFWCFTVVNANNESHSVIISTEDGSVLAKS